MTKEQQSNNWNNLDSNSKAELRGNYLVFLNQTKHDYVKGMIDTYNLIFGEDNIKNDQSGITKFNAAKERINIEIERFTELVNKLEDTNTVNVLKDKVETLKWCLKQFEI